MTSSGPPAGPGDVVELTIGPVAHGGHCVARHEGRVVFVRHTLPGERVRARLTDAGADARFWRADATEVIEASSDRVEPRCPVSGPGGCGGCDWQHADVPAQRRLKAAVVAEQLHRLAGLQIDAEDVTVERVPTPGPAGSEQGPDGPGDGLGWRTRVRLAVAPDGRAGLRAHRSHAVIALVDCPIAHRGLGLPEILSRRWPDDAEIVVAGGDGQPPTVQSVRGSVTELESGPSRRREVAAGRAWRVSGAGFWQVHPGAADALVEAVRQALQPTTGDSLLDLYSGVGLFAGALAGSLGSQVVPWLWSPTRTPCATPDATCTTPSTCAWSTSGSITTCAHLMHPGPSTSSCSTLPARARVGRCVGPSPGGARVRSPTWPATRQHSPVTWPRSPRRAT